MERRAATALIVIGLFGLGMTGCSKPSLQEGRVGNLEIALVEVRDRQDRLAVEFRERLGSMETSLLQQERFLHDLLAAQESQKIIARSAPERSLPAPQDPSSGEVPIAKGPIFPPLPLGPEPRAGSAPEDRPAPAPTPQTRSLQGPMVPGEPSARVQAQALYDRALAKYFQNAHTQARADFISFQERFPDHPLISNALYWLGETHYAQEQFAQSILVFKELSRRFPESSKAPDALLKAGFAYEQLGDYPNAFFHLQIVIDDYPESPAAELARDRLPRLPMISS